MASNDTEARLQRLEDIEAIKNLKHRYCLLCDNDYEPDGLAVLFTEDAVWDGGPFGYFDGRDAIKEFFAGCSDVIKFAIHHVTNPIIEVDGDTATGHWYLWQPMVMHDADRTLWLAARYQDSYRREDGVWKFAHVKITVRLMSPYEDGFGKTPIVELTG